MSEILSLLRALLRTAAFMTCGLVVLMLGLGVLYYPYSTDDPALEVSLDALAAEDFYEEVYSGVAGQPAAARKEESAEHEYVAMGRDAGEAMGANEAVADFVKSYRLENARVLEVGAGSGQLQDIVEDYTGLDIAASAARYFHKPFVHGSATDLPFGNSEFDAAWTVWVLEHVPNPERALKELRRVTRPGGLIFLAPAWACGPWLADGYLVRPYSDFDLSGKLTKASLAFRNHPLYQYAHLVSSRIVRNGVLLAEGGAPTTFHYRRIEPNYGRYWMPDSDAVVYLDPYEALLWFRSRGDECLNCPKSAGDQLLMGLQPLVIRVNKTPGEAIAKTR